MRGAACHLAVLWLAIGASTAMAQAPEDLDGTFTGVNEAAGAEIEIAPESEDALAGTFRDPAGTEQAFEADWLAGGAEAVIDMADGTVLMRMTPLPYGAEVLFVPIDAEGRLVSEAATFYTFLAEGLEQPPVPQGFVGPPEDPSKRIAALSFLRSYQFWPPSGVRDGYLALARRHRTLIRLFAPVQLDVIWKLCLAPGADRALGVALRGQGVSCEEVVRTISEAQRAGRFAAYKAEVDEANAALQQAVRCGDGYVETKEACDRSARRVSEAATSLETAATVLARYR